MRTDTFCESFFVPFCGISNSNISKETPCLWNPLCDPLLHSSATHSFSVHTEWESSFDRISNIWCYIPLVSYNAVSLYSTSLHGSPLISSALVCIGEDSPVASSVHARTRHLTGWSGPGRQQRCSRRLTAWLPWMHTGAQLAASQSGRGILRNKTGNGGGSGGKEGRNSIH